MLFGGTIGALELRRDGDGSARLIGRFGYNEPTTIVPAGRMGAARKEVIAPRAFAPRLRQADAEIHLLVGHDFDRPLASRSTGTLTLTETDAALEIEARITAAIAATSHGKDALALASESLANGLSPGFRLSDDTRAEKIEQEMDGAILRTVLRAELFELSIVTLPAYPRAQIEARSWTVEARSGRRRMLL